MSKRDRRRAKAATRALRSGAAPGMGSRRGEQSPQVKGYRQLAQSLGPRRPLLRNAATAFVVGGLICALGQGVLAFWLGRGYGPEEAVPLTAGTLVLAAALLTGIGVYDAIGQFGGMGSAIPITGFSNSVASPALEFKREGFVLGVGARMFQVAGPVIVYGLLSSVLVAAARMALRAMAALAGLTGAAGPAGPLGP